METTAQQGSWPLYRQSCGWSELAMRSFLSVEPSNPNLNNQNNSHIHNIHSHKDAWNMDTNKTKAMSSHLCHWETWCKSCLQCNWQWWWFALKKLSNNASNTHPIKKTASKSNRNIANKAVKNKLVIWTPFVIAMDCWWFALKELSNNASNQHHVKKTVSKSNRIANRALKVKLLVWTPFVMTMNESILVHELQQVMFRLQMTSKVPLSWACFSLNNQQSWTLSANHCNRCDMPKPLDREGTIQHHNVCMAFSTTFILKVVLLGFRPQTLMDSWWTKQELILPDKTGRTKLGLQSSDSGQVCLSASADCKLHKTNVVVSWWLGLGLLSDSLPSRWMMQRRDTLRLLETTSPICYQFGKTWQHDYLLNWQVLQVANKSTSFIVSQITTMGQSDAMCKQDVVI